MKNTARLLCGGLALAAMLGAGTASAGGDPIQCEVTFHLDQETGLRALQFHADYTKAYGTFGGSGQFVDCTGLIPANLDASNDDDLARVLYSGQIGLEQFYGPADVLSCRFEAAIPPSPGDFDVVVDDAHSGLPDSHGTEICGAPKTGTIDPLATDALVALRTAVGQETDCQLCECDVNSSETVTVSDSLAILKKAVHLPVSLDCPVCVSSSTTTLLEPTTTTIYGGSTTTTIPFDVLPSTVITEEEFVTVSVTVSCPVCGNGTTDKGEECDDANTNDADGCFSNCTLNPCLDCSGEFCVPNDKARCDDGSFCNGVDYCSGGTCSEHAGDPCEKSGECGGGCDEKGKACTATLEYGTPCTGDENACTDDICDGKGFCGVNNEAPCDNGLFCDGADVCSNGECTHAGDPCPQNDCSACEEETDNCFLPAGTACTTDDDRCTDDLCDGAGACAHPPIPLAPVCNWVVVGGSDTEAGHVRTRVDAEIGGSICADTGDVGETAKIVGPGSWALLADTGNALTVRPAAIVEDGSVVTGGGCLVGKQNALLFGTDLTGPICCANGDVELPGGNPLNIINACGTDPLLADCADAKSQIPADVALLDSLGSTQDLGNLNVEPAATGTILADAGLNVIDIGRMKLNRNSNLVIDAQGNADAVVILRMADGMRASRKVDISLAGGLVPENLLFYAQDGNCTLSLGITGAGTIFCPAGNVRLRQDAAWTGAVAGGSSVDVGWDAELVHAPFLGLAQ